MILKQYRHPWLAHLSYLMVDEVSRTGLVIDPCGNPDLYLEEAWRLRTPINHIFLTKAHSDFQRGPRELRDRTGATLYMGAAAQTSLDPTPVKEGDVFEFGYLRVQVLEIPGHTPEGICLLLFDLKRNDRQPQAALTGDTLVVGDVGRPVLDPGALSSRKRLSQSLHASLQGKLASLPEETIVYPGHTSATPCGQRSGAAELSTTIGDQRRVNFALWPTGREEFLRRLGLDRAGLRGAAPLATDADSEWFGWPPERRDGLRPMRLDELLVFARGERSQIVDVRTPMDFSGGHLKGAIQLPLGSRFETWASRILDRTRPVALVTEPGREGEAARALRRAHFTSVTGYLQGGMEALESRSDLVRSTPRVAAHYLTTGTREAATRVLLDVRSPRERRGRFWEGTLPLPLEDLNARMAEIPRDRQVVVASQWGYRSSVAASLLERAGFENVVDLVGGWSALELAV